MQISGLTEVYWDGWSLLGQMLHYYFNIILYFFTPYFNSIIEIIQWGTDSTKSIQFQ